MARLSNILAVTALVAMLAVAQARPLTQDTAVSVSHKRDLKTVGLVYGIIRYKVCLVKYIVSLGKYSCYQEVYVEKPVYKPEPTYTPKPEPTYTPTPEPTYTPKPYGAHKRQLRTFFYGGNYYYGGGLLGGIVRAKLCFIKSVVTLGGSSCYDAPYPTKEYKSTPVYDKKH